MVRRKRRSINAWSLALSLGLVGASGCRNDQVPADSDDDTGDTGLTDTGGSGDETADGTAGETDDPTGETPEDAVPPPGGVRRLLSHQYVSSVEYLLGPEAAAAAMAPEDPLLGTFDALGTLSSVPSAPDVELYEASSTAIAVATVTHPEVLGVTAPCVLDESPGDECYTTIAQDFGRLAWRRPLTEDQVDRLVAVAITAREQEGNDEFWTGVQYMLTAVLQSPYFLYIVELGDQGDADYRELDGYELATRMSFFLNGVTPSAALLDDVAAGGLATDEEVRALAWDLLDHPLARDTIGRFYGEFLTVRNLPSKGKDTDLFPTFTDSLAASMTEETLRLVDDVVFEQDVSIVELFNTRTTFVNDELAAHYGIAPVGPGQWAQVDLPENRAGVLSLSGWLSMMSHNTVNSPTRRGLFVIEQLLCTEVPLPPPRVNPEPILPQEGQTLRESLSQHMEDKACSGCHLLMDPLGFGFEDFDPVGAFRTLDNGQPIDATGTLPGVADFDGPVELAELLAVDERLPRCLVDKTFAGTLGFIPEEPMAPALDAVGTAYSDAGHSMKQLLVELTTSPVFRLVDEPK